VTSLLPLLRLFSLVAAATTPVASTVDLPKIIECRGDMADFFDLGRKMGPDLSGAPLGWKRIEQSNPLITEFEVPRPIKVFGRSTKRIAATGSGLLAILSGATQEALGAELRLKPVTVTPSQSILARIVTQTADDVATTTIRLNVSKLVTHPGKVFAGCEYRVDVK